MHEWLLLHLVHEVVCTMFAKAYLDSHWVLGDGGLWFVEMIFEMGYRCTMILQYLHENG